MTPTDCLFLLPHVTIADSVVSGHSPLKEVRSTVASPVLPQATRPSRSTTTDLRADRLLSVMTTSLLLEPFDRPRGLSRQVDGCLAAVRLPFKGAVAPSAIRNQERLDALLGSLPGF